MRCSKHTSVHIVSSWLRRYPPKTFQTSHLQTFVLILETTEIFG